MKFFLLMSLYLLGYAIGASGQSDRPPGSMDHPASGQYFSFANPSDSEALYEPSSGKNALSEQASGELALVQRAFGEHATGEPGSGEATATSEPAAISEHTAGEHTSSEQPLGEQLLSEQPLGEQPSGEQPSGEQPLDKQPAGEQLLDKQPEQALDEKFSVEQASGEKSLDEQTSSIPSPSTTPDAVINCHTCSYMNDQGQCLRGEGVCSAEKSQKCMLKKIFEGGKLQFMIQGCETMCPSMSLFSHGTRMHIICCRNQSFCNKV
ncbi:acrosomal protein SP-10 [Saccopteryx bilineata]|uniref:acrosomal protein SP-10 n=1 Tax=Saccopteryx bilineata TaxID=59482 RepID=UPI00338EFB49